MLKKVTIEKISRFTKDKNGNPLKGSNGKSYERVLLTVNGKTISGFGSQSNADWQVGEEVTIDITKVDKDGKTYYNFAPVNATSMLLQRVEQLEKKVDSLLQAYPITSEGTKVPDFKETPVQRNEVEAEPPVSAYSEDEINPDEIPF